MFKLKEYILLNTPLFTSPYIMENAAFCIHCAFIVQGEHKRTLHFQNDTENKCGVLKTSHLHQSIEKHSKFCFK
jgi:hypothetical protein